MKRDEIKKKVKELLLFNFEEDFEREVDKLLNSGFIDVEGYDFVEYGYQLPRLIVCLALRRMSESYEPIKTRFMKQYKSLIKNY